MLAAAEASMDARFRRAWPSTVRQLAAFAGSLHAGEELAAEAFARALEQPRPVEDLVAWCTTVGHRLHIDAARARAVRDRVHGELARQPPREAAEPAVAAAVEDDRYALLLVACDPALGFANRLVLALRVVCGLPTARIAWHLGIDPRAASARLTRAKRALAEGAGGFRVPEGEERAERLPAVLECVAAVHAVSQRDALRPADAADDLGRSALTLARAVRAAHPDEPEAAALLAVVLLALARRPARFDAHGAALPLDEVDRSRWDRPMLLAGLELAAATAGSGGRFALEASIAALHSAAPSAEATDWSSIAALHERLVAIRPAPAARVAAAVAAARSALGAGGDLGPATAALRALELEGTAASRRDASLALADLEWRTGSRRAAAARYRALVDALPGPVAAFVRRRIRDAGDD
ncbi:DUF6596 domain-containing protein [Agrococcus sp. Marseille-P2731]|uniref:DUF6596 domain-containing protein n=1 Tax=Agrococcus sp. Marseille-P2731 TaxID=1841862 RepID=UPI0009F90277|nr:DUF6596 domain-containing protein [Agrococcus sp. Marseille-P2731]